MQRSTDRSAAQDRGKTMQNTILVVDDNSVTLSLNRSLFIKEGYRVLCASTGEAALQEARHQPDCIVLDVLLPDANGYELAAQLRQICPAPIIFLTSCKEDSDIVTSLSAGDDYMAKPYSFAELTARVRNHIRHYSTAGRTLVFDKLVIHRDSFSAAYDGKPLSLTSREFGILLALAECQGHPITTAELYRLVWNDEASFTPHVVMVNISTLKKKLERASGGLSFIVSQRGEGYTFAFPPVEPEDNINGHE